MRVRSQPQLPSVPAVVLALLLAMPTLTLAATELPTITMYPETAGPGSTVEVTGIDFPGGGVVELHLVTPDGTAPLTSVPASADGDFRQVLALPPDARAGMWELQAAAGDGTIASLTFATDPEVAAAAAEAAAAAAAAATTTTSRGNSGADIMFMLVLAVLLGAITFGAMVAYRQLRDDSPPGMGKGDDLIWGAGPASAGPELTASEEPHWKSARSAQTEG